MNGDGCTYRTAAHEFTYHDYSTGFRCCADPHAADAEEWPPAAPGATHAAMSRSNFGERFTSMMVGSMWFNPPPSQWATGSFGDW